MMSRKSFVLAAAAALLLAAPTLARTTVQDIAHDASGKPIVDARNNCVLTKWEVSGNNCGRTMLTREQRTVYFDFNSSVLKSSEKKKLDVLVSAVKSSKDVESVDIFGHADKIGNDSYNNRLSMKRAQAVKSYLAGKGVKTRKMELKALGESESVTKCDDSLPRKELIACLAEDRRVEVEFNYVK